MGQDQLTVSLPLDLSSEAEETVYGGTATLFLEGGGTLRTSPSAAQVIDLWLDTNPSDPSVTLTVPVYPEGESIGLERSGTARVRLTAVIAVARPWVRPDANW